jgi:glutathione S-transferase
MVADGAPFNLGDMAPPCGLACLDFRLPEIGWREPHPPLAARLDQANRRPLPHKAVSGRNFVS